MHCAVSHQVMLCHAPGPWCRQLFLSETFPAFSTCSSLQLEWSRIEYKVFTSSKCPVGASSCPTLQSHLNLLFLPSSSSHINPLHTPVCTKFFVTSSFPHTLFCLHRSMSLFSTFHLLNFYIFFKTHFTFHPRGKSPQIHSHIGTGTLFNVNKASYTFFA